MNLASFRAIANKTEEFIKGIFSEHLARPYNIIPANCKPQGHYWSISCAAFLDDDRHLRSLLCHIQTQSSFSRGPEEITEFFRENSMLLDELLVASEEGILNELKSILTNNLDKKDDNRILPFIDIEARFSSCDPFYSALLEEDVCLIESSDAEPIISCMQSERWWICFPAGDKRIYYLVPFDKMNMFPGAIRVKYPDDTIELPKSSDEDENYIFVVMSFSKEPVFIDVYKAIERGVKRWNRKCNVEKVDQIEDDFKITDRIFQCIERASIVIADLTGERPNVYYELGYARGLNKRVIHLAKKDTLLHFDVKDFNTIIYDNMTNLEQSLAKRLRSMMKRPTQIKRN